MQTAFRSLLVLSFAAISACGSPTPPAAAPDVSRNALDVVELSAGR
jgi:hypothetical protein